MPSKQEILVNVTPQETRVAVIEGGVVEELHVERARARGIVGNIYKGKVARVLPGMQAAFIDIGLEKNGFLHAADINRATPLTSLRVDDGKASGELNIQDLVHQGESVWVQAVKDPIDNKGARLTTELSIASRNLVYLPAGTEIGISQKIESRGERARLKSLVQDFQLSGDLPGGFIIRTLADSANDQDIGNDMDFLHRLWKHIRRSMQSAKSASLVYEEIPLTMRTLRDLVREDLTSILVDSEAVLTETTQFARDFLPEVVGKIELYTGPQPLFDLYSIEHEIQTAMQRRVALISGGYLVIDQTEAMTTIDVNTGSYVGQGDHQDTLFKTNLEAASEIAHQLRLRNTGGIIIIDFIDMLGSKHKQQVLSALELGLCKDRIKTLITQMSPLGLVEITRKRTRESLANLMCESCVTCDGRGLVKTGQTVCYEIMREILREDSRFKAPGYTIIASSAVIDLMRDEEAASIADLREFIQRPIKLQVDQHYHQQQFDIALNSP